MRAVRPSRLSRMFAVPMIAALGMVGLAPPKVAQTPPMGWNSWDCFGASVREDEVKANADYMAKHLKRFGWEYIVVDIQWYEPTANGWDYHAGARLDLDAYGRPVPSLNRFPSAAGGKGFAPLAAYCHKKGLKFGIHILRGVPRQAVREQMPVLGTTRNAAEIADSTSTCPWNEDMYGVDTSRPGAQEWYDSLIRQYKSWGVDFIKVDDLSRPYATGEINAIRSAIDRISPTIVFSMSPGETPVEEAEHAKSHANMWRISDDFWDRWDALKHAFELCERWQGSAGPGHWPDADMLPFGTIGKRPSPIGRATNFTRDEQLTVMTLWAMARSPLIFGGHLPDNDAWTTSLITNPEVIDILQESRENRQAFRDGDRVVWTAKGQGKTIYVALFNLGEYPASVALAAPGHWKVRDLWARKNLPEIQEALSLPVASHGARLLALHPGVTR